MSQITDELDNSMNDSLLALCCQGGVLALLVDLTCTRSCNRSAQVGSTEVYANITIYTNLTL